MVLELNGNNEQVGRNIYGTNLLMRTVKDENNINQSYYYMYNGHADVTALINTTTGNIDATYYYDAFGNLDPTGTTGSVNNSITYAGYQYDKETGLYYLNARMYDPKVARFLQEDTYTGTADDPLSLNLYTYVKNNPLIYYDPTGHLESKISLHSYYQNAQVPIVELANAAGASVVENNKAGTVEVVLNGKSLTYSSEYRTNLDGLYFHFGMFDSISDVSPIIEAYDLLYLYGSLATSVEWYNEPNNVFVQQMMMDYDKTRQISQITKELDILQELLLENKAVQSNKELFNCIANHYINYSLFDSNTTKKYDRMLRSNSKFDKVISDELRRREIKTMRSGASFALDMIEVVDWFKGGVEIVTSYDYIAGEKVDNFQKGSTIVGMAAPFIVGSIAKRIKPILKSEKSADGIAAKIADKIYEGASAGGGSTDDFITLYHGTSSNKASKILGSKYKQAKGFREGIDGLVFFSEDLNVAKHFLRDQRMYKVGDMFPRSYTVIEIKVPKNIYDDFANKGLIETGLIGSFNGAPYIDVGNGLETVLRSGGLLDFNRHLLDGTFEVRRLKYK